MALGWANINGHSECVKLLEDALKTNETADESKDLKIIETKLQDILSEIQKLIKDSAQS